MKPNYMAALLMFILPITWTSCSDSTTSDAVPFTYTLVNGGITITRYTGSGGDVVIPGTIDGYPVTTIGKNAFWGCASLTEVVIPDSVTTIGSDAFYECTSLTVVVIPDSTATICDGAFVGCTALTEVAIPDSVTSIGHDAFHNCTGLTQVAIGSGVSSIDDFAFADCFSLTNFSVAAENPNYTSLGGVLFNKDLTTLLQFPRRLVGLCTIPDSVTRIDSWALRGCTGLTNISVAAENRNYASLGGVLFDKALTTLVQFPGGLVGSYVIPDSVTTIGIHAFTLCTNLTEIVIPNSVTTIGDYAFVFCIGLTNVVIPDNVTSIGHEAFWCCFALTKVVVPDSVTNIGGFGYRAFSNCSGLTNISVARANPNYTSLDGVLFDKALTTLVQVPGGLVGSYVIPDGVATIGGYAFEGSTGLTNVVIPDSVTTISNRAFNICTGLTEVEIPDSVTSIGWGAFDGCNNLTNVVIGSGVTDIYSGAFAYCYRLRKVYFRGNAPKVTDRVFSGNEGTVYYLEGTTGWGDTFGGWPTALYQPALSSKAEEM